MSGLFVFLVLAVVVIIRGQDVQSPSVDEGKDVYYPALNWSDIFDWKLLKEFASDNRNVVFSPISLRIVLALLYQGSSGATEREFQNVMQFVDKVSVRDQYRDVLTALQVSEKNEYVLNMGSRIFLRSEIEPKQKFASVAKDFFKTDIEPIDFSEANSSEAINSWVDKLTNGRITQLVKPEELRDTIMLIANAVYFKGSWRHQFPKNQSFHGNFYLVNNDDILTVTVPYMTNEEQFYYVESQNFDAKILRLPYKGGRYSMIIILPNSKGGLPALLKRINLYNVKSLLYLMDKRTVKVTLPKFKFDFQKRLAPILQKFGMHQMFQNTASFPGIARGNSTLLRKLVVSDVIQKAGIELDETGTVAYAATEISISDRFGGTDEFEASHPFAFFIQDDKSGTVQFAGILNNPLEELEANEVLLA
ncbi:serine protease inhibitor 27A-like isoform X2 [Anoplophora glabripennis]|uniref:serine protease inhibitor 27A-like isoform X2 n=1 Tax=Anoplophora glabripennis TaxID=217634 RepID=UPI000875998B|nr:serine protease inhibitor 27A-like isoform X2 [Anoplophora glabripennis]